MKKGRIYSIYHGRFPGERAAALFAAKEAESFADAGMETVLLVPRRRGRETKDPYAYFGVKKKFRVVYLPTIDLFGLPLLSRFAFVLSFVTFGISTFIYLLLRASRNGFVYSNESFPTLLATYFFPNTMIAVHDFPEQKQVYYATLFRRVKKILSTNNWKKEALLKKFRISPEKIVVIPNAVDVEEFALDISREEARKKLALPIDKKIAVYTGHLYAWKGVDTLAEAAKELVGKVEIYFVGGREEDIESFKKRHTSPNIHMAGFRPHAEIPLWQKAADVLVLPNTAKEEISAHYTSPMKLFEYMASGTPIVASRIPSIVEHITDNHAVLVPADNPLALMDGIMDALNGQGSVKHSENASLYVSNLTWRERAEKLSRFIGV